MLKAVRNFLFPVIWGTDFSGVVAEVGPAVTLFKPGDEVYGYKDGSVAKTYRGTYAEFAVVPEKSVSRKPANLTLARFSRISRGLILKNLQDSSESDGVSLDIDGHPALQYEIRGMTKQINFVYVHTAVETPSHFRSWC